MAPLVALLALLPLAAQERPVERCSLSGVVTDSKTHAPLTKVQVLAETEDRRSPPASTTTDNEGNFTLVDLAPGAYRLLGIRNGYLNTYYGARTAAGKGTILTVEPGQEMKGLELKLLPFAVIAGTVRDPEGEPLVQAKVALISLTYRNGRRQATATGQYAETDDLGQFRIPDVAPGRYYVRAGPKYDDGRSPVDHSPKPRAQEVLVPAFHPASRELGAARIVEVAAGDRFTGADVTLLRSRLFHVRVRAEAPAGLGMGVSLGERLHLNDGIGLSPSSQCKDHVCDFARVPSGRYTAMVTSQPQDPTMRDLFYNRNQTRISTPVDVTDSDVDGIRLVLDAGAEVAGRVSVAGQEHPKLDNALLQFIDAEGNEDPARVAADGAFKSRLTPGHYTVQVENAGDLIVASMRSDDIDVLRDGLTMPRAGKVPLEIVFSADGATLDGIVRDNDDQPAPGATLVLIPEARYRFRPDLYKETTTDQYGRYRLRAIPPSDYKLFAWSDVEPDIWFDPDFLKDVEDQGQSVHLSAKGHETVNLRLVGPRR